MKKLIPIPASKVAAGKVSLTEIKSHKNKIYWLESKPEDKGRRTLKCFYNGQEHDLLPREFSINSKVHEYGGGVYQLVDDTIYFVNARDQRIYKTAMGDSP